MEWHSFDRGVFLVNVLGIVYDPKTKKILIGRRENDPHLDDLSWCFPGGRPAYDDDLEKYLKHEIRKKTSLDVDVKKIIWARTYPKKRHFLLIYYYCEVVGGEEKAGERHVENKWVNPGDVEDYMLKPIPPHPEVLNFLKNL